MRTMMKFLTLLSVLLVTAHPMQAAQLPTSHPPSSESSQTPADNASEESPSGQGSYIINAGDVLQITVWKEDGLDRETLVLPDGTIDFPLIGTVAAKGQTPSDVQSTIKHKLRKYIPDAAVTVVVKAALGHTVSVIGQVTKPGEIVMGRRLTVMEALSQAGGLTPYASEGHIVVLRHGANNQETSIPFPYDDVADGEHLEKDIVLNPGDVVVVPTAGLF